MNNISSPELGGGSVFLKRVCAYSSNNGEQSYHNLFYLWLLKVQELRMSYESQSILMTEFNVCPVCKKRFGNQRYELFLLYCKTFHLCFRTVACIAHKIVICDEKHHCMIFLLCI
jgi:hypothetical protein